MLNPSQHIHEGVFLKENLGGARVSGTAILVLREPCSTNPHRLLH